MEPIPNMVVNRFHLVLGLVTVLGLGYLIYDYSGLGGAPIQGLTGTVRIEGKPVRKGTVLFLSLDEKHPGLFGGSIQNGRYVVPEEFGLPHALYHVEFSSIGDDDIKRSMKAPRGRDRDRDDDEQEEVILKEEFPARFNSQSNVKLDLSSGGVLEADFDLK